MTARAERNSDRTIRSISRALHTIEHLARADGPLGVVQVSQELRLPRSTAHRILATLVREGYVARDPKTEGYVPALRFVELGGLVQRRLALCNQARPHLRRLVHNTGESVALAAFDGNRVLVVDQVENPDRMRPWPAVGAPRPLHCTAAGKAVLAALPPARAAELVGSGPLPRHTDKTIVLRITLVEHLASIRERGYAIEDEEREQGVRAVACAIRSRGTTEGAIEIAGPAVRLSPDRIDELARYISQAAAELSLSMGGEVDLVR